MLSAAVLDLTVPVIVRRRLFDLASAVTEGVLEKHVKLRFRPRSYQMPLLRALESGVKRVIAVWHRRAGKDLTCWNWTLSAALERVGTYYFFYPTYTQGKKILWLGMDAKGVRFRDYLPPEIRADTREHETELRMELPNGSIIQIVGSDNIDSIVGTNPVGCVFSEYSLQDPRGWDYVRPILRENDGWSIFIYTPRGRNHGYRLWEAARKLPDEWFSQLLTIDDTYRDAPGENGLHVITNDDVNAEIAAGMDEDLAQQEFYCNFAGITEGAYYSRQMALAREEGRVSFVPYNEKLPVHTAWDLGFDDATSVWMVQVDGTGLGLIDYYEESGLSIVDHITAIEEKPYSYGVALMPWDYESHDVGTGMSRREIVEQRFPKFEAVTVPKMRVQEGINAVRSILPRCRFDAAKCERGIDAVASYSRQYDEKKRAFRPSPMHDWASHGADAFRYLALGVEELREHPSQVYADTRFSPYDYDTRLATEAEHEFSPHEDTVLA